MKLGWLGILLSVLAASEGAALAQSSLPTSLDLAPSSTSTSPILQAIRDRGKAVYTMWVTGPTVESMDGKTGAGSDLTLNQFAMVGFKLSSKWTVSATQYWTNTTRELKPTETNLSFKDPYVSFTNSSITSSRRYGTNLMAQVRYYLPISPESINTRGAGSDFRNGRLRFRIEPSKTMADGLIDLKLTSFFIKNLSSGQRNEGVTAQKNSVVWFYPSLNFNVSDSFQPYVAYSNYLENYNDQNRGGAIRWNRFNEKHNLELGFNWQPAKGFNINPYLEYGPVFIPKASSVGLIAEYAFL